MIFANFVVFSLNFVILTSPRCFWAHFRRFDPGLTFWRKFCAAFLPFWHASRGELGDLTQLLAATAVESAEAQG
jgi:hypothetical protein